jgi:hypothetical protein
VTENTTASDLETTLDSSEPELSEYTSESDTQVAG